MLSFCVEDILLCKADIHLQYGVVQYQGLEHQSEHAMDVEVRHAGSYSLHLGEVGDTYSCIWREESP